MGEYRFSALAAYYPRLTQRLRQYDVINLHGPAPTRSDAFLVLSRLLSRGGPPIVYTHHSALEIRGAERLCAVYNALHRKLSARSDKILTTSAYYAELERSPAGPDVEVIPWGVDVRPEPSRARAEQRPLRVLFVGQMRTYKGVEWLLPAVAGQPGIELTLVGGGAHLEDYRRLAEGLGGENIRFLGRIPDEVLHAEYDRSDVVVLPSVTRAEAFGLVTLEGMAEGCVPVVSDLPGVRDLVDGVGVVVPPRDVDALRAALLSLAADPLRLDRAGRAARRRAEGLSWTACAARYEAAFREAAGLDRRRVVPMPQVAYLGRVVVALPAQAAPEPDLARRANA
jgi:rhamnosyl/mannosyltransferase